MDYHFDWTDQAWSGLSLDRTVIYELHIGTFTKEGTWTEAAQQLPELAEIGVGAIEVMPVADFPGRMGWGYDGVNLFAPCRLYGSPDDFRRFVNRAHNLGLGVILDVVYNHFGPSGNFLREFSPHYFHSTRTTDWGDSLNFDGDNSAPVREFFLTNASYWIEEFHLDGLRLDATSSIHDSGNPHILAEIAHAVRRSAGNRKVVLIAESELQNSRVVRRKSEDGYELDALWNDDFHHAAKVALTGKREGYYSDFTGRSQELLSAVKHGFLFQGQWHTRQKWARGKPTFKLPPGTFINFLQNHDQVANSIWGLRLHKLTSPGRLRAMTALLLLSPGTPMIFQGQEFNADSPFLYFADHDDDLNGLIAKGRAEFLSQFAGVASAQAVRALDKPADVNTFEQCKLDFSDRQRNATIYTLFKDLLQLRKTSPVFTRSPIDGFVLNEQALGIRFFGDQGHDRLLLLNLGPHIERPSFAEPLLAPPEDQAWRLAFSTEDIRYGGSGAYEPCPNGQWQIPGEAALLMSPGCYNCESA